MRFCPYCGSDLSSHLGVASQPSPAVVATKVYNQTATWKRLLALALERKGSPLESEALVGQVRRVAGTGPHKSIVHIAFDRNVVPQGGVLRQMASLDGQIQIDAEHLEARGYVLESGKISTVNDQPVGQAFQVLDYWGGTKQHPRWHMTRSVELSAARNGDPFFMDDNMVAFGATWRDMERLDESFYSLIDLFTHGINKSGRVAVPLVLDVFWC